MTPQIRLATAFALVSLSFVPVAAQHSAMPPGMTHEQHLAQIKKDAEMKRHGNMAMGFDQDKATHHFTLTADGGTIAVTANDAPDQKTRDQIRTHLGETARAFANGDFHSYTFESTDRGGRVRMTTSNPEALNAVHEFLRYQIKEHATGDPITVQE